MNGHQRFLCQILRLGCGSANTRKLSFIVGAQIGTEPAKKDTVSCRIATEARPHQAPKLGFVRYHLLILVVRKRTGFGYKNLTRESLPYAALFWFWHYASKFDYYAAPKDTAESGTAPNF